MALYRDQVVRVGMPQLKARFRPSVLKAMTSVRLQCGRHVADVELVVQPCVGLPSRFRTCMRCSRCSRTCDLVGCVPDGIGVEPGWGCAACTGWRGRWVPYERRKGKAKKVHNEETQP